MNRNQESIEQLKRLTQSAKNFYGNNYSPGFISHKNDVKHYLGEEYIPYDWGDDIDSPANDEYKKVYMNKNPNYNFLQKTQTQNLMQTPKPMQQTTQFQAPKPQTMKTQPTGLMPKQKLKGFGDYMVDYKEIANKIWDGAVKNYPIYKIGDAAGTLHAVKQNMDQHNLINGDNYYHRLGMCLNGQKDAETAVYSFLGGLAKEPADIAKKTYKDVRDGKAFWGSLWDNIKGSGKDIYNNYEATVYGLTNPDKDCRIWLEDLDINTNTWRNK